MLDLQTFAAFSLSPQTIARSGSRVAAIAVEPDRTWTVPGCYEPRFTLQLDQLEIAPE